MSFLCSPQRKERAVKFIQISSIIKLEIPKLPPDLPKSYISQVSRTIQLDVQPLVPLLALFCVT